MRVAVTGGAGYIGSVVVETLIERGHGVLVLDNLCKGHRDAVHSQAEFAHVDLSECARVGRVLSDFSTDAVVHMAAYSLVGESVSDPAKYYGNNVINGLSLLSAMRQAGVKRLVFSSTAAVYGDPVQQPITEDALAAPTNSYGETKLAFERILHWYGSAYGMSSTSLRYFNAAGASALNGERHDPETHLIPLVLNVAAGVQRHVTIFGDDYPTRDGTCVRDYIHILDLAEAHALALEATSHAGSSRSYNLGLGNQGYSVAEIISTAEAITGRKIPTIVAPRRAGDPPTLIANADRIRLDLGWRPRYQLNDMIQSAWEFMRRPIPS